MNEKKEKYYVINWDDGSTNGFDTKKEAEDYLSEKSVDLPKDDLEVIKGQLLEYAIIRADIIEK